MYLERIGIVVWTIMMVIVLIRGVLLVKRRGDLRELRRTR